MERGIRFPRTQEKASGGRPACCPFCGFGRVRINGRCRRRLIDPRVSEAVLVRYRCGGCGHSWRVYPEGVNRNTPQSKCQQVVSATLYLLGLSYDKASVFLEALGCEVVVSDELDSYKPAAEAAGVEHQLSLAHWRKAVSRRLKKIEGYEGEKQLLQEALKQLDPVARRRLRGRHRRFAKAPPPAKGERQSPAYAMRMLTLDCLENG